jgi:two-component system sensor histidine kinase MprB
MSLRARLTLVTCVTVAVAVVVVSVLGYAAVRRQLLEDVDRQLQQRAELAVASASVVQVRRMADRDAIPAPETGRRPGRGFAPLDPFADPDTAFQIVDSSGTVLARPGGNPLELPVDGVDRDVAAAPAGATARRTVTVGDRDERMLTMAAGDDVAVQVSRSLASTEDTLDTLVVWFAVVGGAVIAVAVTTGLLLTRRSLQPIGRLTDAAEQIARTKEFTADIGDVGTDEVGRLSAAFNEMVDALAGAREQQRQLVADASHELRTPLTSLRTNIELLSRAATKGQLDELDAAALMSDVRHELEALSMLVSEVVELATDASAADAGGLEELDLAALAEEAAARATRRYGMVVDVRVGPGPTTVPGVRGLIERALSNLLDNAAKWDDSGRPVEIDVERGRVLVRDHGPGLRGADPARLFDRFYRGPETQSTPGSGLGLAIVEQAVDRHGGRVLAGEGDGGGAVIGFALPDADGNLAPGTS